MSLLTLAIDQGSHATRVVVSNADGKTLAHSQRPIDLQRPKPDRAEHDASQILATILECIDAVAATLGERCQDIKLAGLATQRSTALCWDSQSGQPLSPALSWQDVRGANWMPLDEQRVRAISGLQASPHYGASKLRWCLDQLSSVQQARDQDRLVAGPLSAWLVGTLNKTLAWKADPCNAQRTQLWSLETQSWSDELKQMFDLSELTLPQLQANEADWGTLNVAGTAVPLRVVTGDQQAALFANGLPDLETIYINLGTGAFVQQLTATPQQVQAPLLTSIVHRDVQQSVYAAEGTVNGCGSAITWLEQQYKGQLPHPEMALREVPNPPLFLNGVGGLGSPYWAPHFESRLVNANTPIKALAAVIESIAFLIQRNVELMPKGLCIVVSGGLARVDGLCQRIASLSGLSVLRYREVEASSAGLARMLAAEASDPALPQGAFEPRFDAALVARYRQWCALMQTTVAENTLRI